MEKYLAVMLLLLAGVDSQEKHRFEYWNDYINEHLSHGVTKFAIDLNRVIDAHENYENIAFSPLNLAGLLGVLLLGSVGKSSETLSALGFHKDDIISGDSEFLHHMFADLMNSVQSSGSNNIKIPEILSNNSIYIQNGFSIRPNFAAFVRDVYKYNLAKVDFIFHPLRAKRIINDWVYSATRGKISNFLTDPMNDMTRIFLASAVYFNGKWKYSFKEDETKKETFYLESGKNVFVNMMKIEKQFLYHSSGELGADIVGLPYQVNVNNKSPSKTTMFVVLPHSNLSDFILRLGPEIINSLMNQMTYQRCIVQLPRMKLSSSLTLEDKLQSLGFTSMFDPDLANLGLLSTGESNLFVKESLDFSPIKNENPNEENVRPTLLDFHQYVKAKKFSSYGLDELRWSGDYSNPGLHVSSALHKVEIDINEKGTEAVAGFTSDARGNVVNKFKCNRPFLFFIRHDPSGLISFWGAIRKPTPSY